MTIKAWLHRGMSIAALIAAGVAEAQTPPAGTGVTQLGDVIVTAPSRVEPLSQSASTIQVITEETIRNSSAKSLTDLLAENAVGFFSEWTPGQTSINIRGAASDGQGKDFRSDVVVLLNGRRAGTANISKLSLADVHHVEIVRGPGSVIYGSQALGGVINIITRNGRNSDGSTITGQVGSWAFGQLTGNTAGQVEGFDYYFGANGATRDDFESAHAKMENTQYRRFGGMASLGYQIDTDNRLDFMVRSDGVYDVGFRGSQWDTDNVEDRYNQSVDLAWSGGLGGTSLTWTGQFYYFRDVDDFKWGSERQRNGTPGYDIDDNKRVLKAVGGKIIPRFSPWQGNDLLVGLDVERAWLRSDRFRFPVRGAAATQVAPFDNNEDNLSLGVYAEDVQRLFDDRVTLRAGARYSYGEQSIVSTPFQPLLKESSQTYDTVTYSAGVAVRATDWLKLRTGVATGFRAPTASELAADFTAVGGSQTLGNPGLTPESSIQYEFGTTLSGQHAFLDLALFQNTIEDRITTRTVATNISQNINATGDVVVRGVEAQMQYDLAGTLGWDSQVLRFFGNASWNFDLEDKGADPLLTGDYKKKVQRAYEYQASIGATYGWKGIWDARLVGILRGPIFYDTEEGLLIPLGEPNDRYVHRKDPFWVLNSRINWYPLDNVTVFGAVNNIFNVDDHPLFIALNDSPFVSDPRGSNGARGNSIPGREFILGAQVRF